MMHGIWNTVIKSPYVQLYTVFIIKEDNSGGISLRMETEPLDMGLTFKDLHTEGNRLKATAIGVDGKSRELALIFEGETFSGSLRLPYQGDISFTGRKGSGISLSDKLQKYGEKSVQENHYWNAKWIWDVKQPEANDVLEHHLVYFRRNFHLAEGINPKLMIDITADSRYRLYVNGNSVCVGPCKGDQHVHFYESLDVSEYLVPGNNVLAVKVLRYPSSEPFKIGEGGPISVWRSQSAGLLVEASLRDENGVELEALHSGSEWRSFRHQSYRHVPKQFIRWMGGVEEVDGSGAPFGWELPDFDDSNWKPALPFAETRGNSGNLSPWNLVPRPIPFMYEKERPFLKVTKLEGMEHKEAEKLLQEEAIRKSPIEIQANQKIIIELDAGELTTGYLTVGLRGGQGSTVQIMGSECYEPNESNGMMARKKGNREDTTGKLMGEFDVYHVAGFSRGEEQEEVYEPFWFRTFRYVRIEIETANEPLILSYLNYRETGYPLDVKGKFECSDDELNTIWDLSVRTLKRCMHETYEDCPYYEQLQYAMDSRLMMLFTYYISADDRMPRRTIADFYRSRQPDGLLQSRYPSTQPQVIPSFALYWVDMLAEHFEYNGDINLIKTYRPALIELMDWFDDRLTDENIVGVTSNKYWTYFDWVEAWPLGAPPESIERPMFLLSLMYAASLKKAADLLSTTGWSDAAAEMIEKADRVCLAVRKLSWSEERKLFRDLPDLEIYSQHMQIMAVISGMVEGEEAKHLLERALTEPIHRVTLPFSYLLIQALKKTDLQHHIFELWDRWRVFASQGLTTLPETEVNPRSDCHAWSAVPLAEFPATILGVSPAEPGWSTVTIAPQVGKLQWAKGSVATVKGKVEVNWVMDEKEFKLHAKVPEGVTANIKLPDGSEQILLGEGRFQCDALIEDAHILTIRK